MTLLNDIISASTDTSKSTPDLLRMVRIVARRVGATQIETWAKHEVGGYAREANLPPYRRIRTNVRGLFTGPLQSQIPYDLTVTPEGMESLWEAELRQPRAELQALANAPGESDPTIPWPAQAVEAYERLGGLYVQNHGLFKAHQVITRQSLLGVIDSIRLKVLDFALDLQDQFPDAGEPGGPNVSTQPALERIVYNIENNITGHGASVAAGSHISQSSRVRAGDIEGLRREALALGLPEADADELVAAVEEERDVSGPRTSRILERVRSKAITLSGSVGSDVVVGLLAELVKQYLGLQ